MVLDIFRTFVLVIQKVTDISKILQAMTEEMRLMRETIDSQHSEICNRNRNAEALHKEIRNVRKGNKKIREGRAK